MWLNDLTNMIVEDNKNSGEIILTTSVSPTGLIHIGKLRDISILHFLSNNLKNVGFCSKTILYWDDFDTFHKKCNDILLQEELNKPLYMVTKYGERICEEYKKIFLEELKKLGIIFDQVISQADRYSKGKYKEYIELIDTQKIDIINILKPYIPVSSLENYNILKNYCINCNRGFSISNLKNIVKCTHCGHEQIPFNNIERIKMPFFLEWPARWSYDNSHFEPIGKDHATANGVYYRAKDISEKVYLSRTPIVQRFEFVGGSNGEKMSVSNKKGFTINQLIEIFPSEIILWMFFKVNPEKYLVLDIYNDNNYLKIFIEFYRNYTRNNNLIMMFEKINNIDLSKYENYNEQIIKEIFNFSNYIDFQADLTKMNLIYSDSFNYSQIISYFLKYRSNNKQILNVNLGLLKKNKDLIKQLQLFLLESTNLNYHKFSENFKNSFFSETNSIKIIKKILFGDNKVPALSKMLFIYSKVIKNIEV